LRLFVGGGGGGAKEKYENRKKRLEKSVSNEMTGTFRKDILTC
jgi:hypothetical protein